MTDTTFAPSFRFHSRHSASRMAALGDFRGSHFAMLAIYFVGAEQGATSIFGGMYVHEFVHDRRHLLGFPCH